MSQIHDGSPVPGQMEQFGQIPTLRDEFAMAALTGWGEGFHGFAYRYDGPSSVSPTPDSIAETCYQLADAMLKAREAK